MALDAGAEAACSLRDSARVDENAMCTQLEPACIFAARLFWQTRGASKVQTVPAGHIMQPPRTGKERGALGGRMQACRACWRRCRWRT